MRGFLVDAYVQAGRFREANEEVDRISDSTMMKNVVLGYAYGALGRRAEAAELVERLLESAQQRYIAPYHLAIVYAGLQDAEAALRWLERAYEERSVWLTWLKVEPKFDGLRADPRFADLMRRVGFASG